jgi:hypothetical protein
VLSVETFITTDRQSADSPSGESFLIGSNGSKKPVSIPSLSNKDMGWGEAASARVVAQKPWGAVTEQTRDDKSSAGEGLPEGWAHAVLSWTACYNDSCFVHLRDKEGAGWYPRKPSKKRRGAKEGSP